MKLIINLAIFVVAFSILKATEFSEEDIKMFLPFIKRWVPPPCPMNQIYKTCVSDCSDCTQRGRCIMSKCKEGCDCAPRFFKVTPDGPCEPVANCPKPECGENEIFRECGPICETCTTMECHVISCDHKCYCKEGYLRNKEGNCIPKEECPIRTRCTRTEEWAESGPVDEFCVHAENEDMSNKTQDIAGCYCKEGYKRNILGHCVNETMCQFIRCFGNEVYQQCIPKCNTTCRNYGDADCIEDDNCYQGCFCSPGYVMNDFRSCIKIENCTLDVQQVKVISASDVDESIDTTLPPTCSDTDGTTISTESTSIDHTAELTHTEDETHDEDHTEDETTVEEMTSVTASEYIISSASPTSATSVSDLTPNEKSHKKDKATKQKEAKHENVAKEKEATKYKIIEDENDFANENI